MEKILEDVVAMNSIDEGNPLNSIEARAFLEKNLFVDLKPGIRDLLMHIQDSG
jgi:hypothetical protein